MASLIVRVLLILACSFAALSASVAARTFMASKATTSLSGRDGLPIEGGPEFVDRRLRRLTVAPWAMGRCTDPKGSGVNSIDAVGCGFPPLITHPDPYPTRSESQRT